MKDRLLDALKLVQSYCQKTDCEDCCIEKTCKVLDEHSPDGWVIEEEGDELEVSCDGKKVTIEKKEV